MLDQNTFTETIRAVQEIIRTSAEPMSREEILSYFKDMDLNAQQEEMVFTFLSTPHEEEPLEAETEEPEQEAQSDEAEAVGDESKKEVQEKEQQDVFSDSPMFHPGTACCRREAAAKPGHISSGCLRRRKGGRTSRGRASPCRRRANGPPRCRRKPRKRGRTPCRRRVQAAN